MSDVESQDDFQEDVERRYEEPPALKNVSLAMLASLAVSGQVERAHSSEVEPSMSWDQGIETLKEEVYNSPFETAVVFAKYKDGTSEWLEHEYTDQTNQSVSYNNKDVRSLVRSRLIEGKNLDATCSVHIHPLEGLEAIELLEEGDTDKIRHNFNNGNETPNIVMPPSHGDITNVRMTKLGWMMSLIDTGAYDKQINDPNTEDVPKHFSMLADPSGIWYYDYNPELESVEHRNKMKNYGTQVENLVHVVKSNFDTLSTDGKKELETIVLDLEQSDSELSKLNTLQEKVDYLVVSNADERVVNILMSSEQDKLQLDDYLKGLESQKLFYESFKQTVRDYSEAAQSRDVPKETNDALYEMYNNMGIELRHVPYEEIQNEPDCSGI
jgi:hypothetical protein